MTRSDLLEKLGELRIRPLLQERDWSLVCDESFKQLFLKWDFADGRIVDLADQTALEALRDKGALAIVCCEGPEGPVQNRLKEIGVQSIALFGQLIHRVAAQVQPRFAVGKAKPAELEYSILCLPRCGSTLLTRELGAAGAGNPTEHFKAFLQPLLREREVSGFDLLKWWEIVRLGNVQDGVFGTKIIFDIWKMADRFMRDQERETIIDYIKSRPTIYLEREDKLGQAVSDVIARKTGVWHLWNSDMKSSHSKMRDQLLDEYRRDESKIDADLVDAVQTYRKFEKSERGLLEFIDDNAIKVTHIRYSDYVKDTKRITADVARSIGVKVTAEYADSDVGLEPTGTAAHDLLKERLKVLVR